LRGAYGFEYRPDFIKVEDGGKTLLLFCLDKVECVPVAFEHIDEEEFDAAIANTHRGGRPCVDVFSVQEVVLEFLFGDQVWGFAIKIDQHPNRACVSFLGGRAHTGQLQGSHGLLIIVFHHTFLLSFEGLIGWRSNIERYGKIGSPCNLLGIYDQVGFIADLILPRSGLLDSAAKRLT